MNVLIILGHPRRDSLCGALADAYHEGLLQTSAEGRLLAITELTFDPNVTVPSPRDQQHETAVLHAQRLITWADHLVFVYPNWWGTMPALLKGFLDRVLTPGFAFDEREDGGGWKQLLTGKTAHLITTMDTPSWIYRWILRQPGHNAMRRATLNFCGVQPVQITSFGVVKDASARQRKKWLARAQAEGRRLQHGAVRGWPYLRDRLFAWLQALRLPFYPMTWIAYTAGAAGTASSSVFSYGAYWLGYACLFLIEAATVFANDYFDFASDRQNKHYGPFTGGSRVLVDERLSFRELRGGIGVALSLFAATAAGLLAFSPGTTGAILLLLGVLLVLALGYTIPPLKLSHRGLGEIDVGLTHSVAATACGYVFLGGTLYDAFSWLLGVPLFLSVLPAILLSGLPDYDADQAAGKNTLVVKLGRRRALWLAMILIVLAAAAGVLWHELGLARGAFGAAIYLALPHAGLLLYLLGRQATYPQPPTRIDGLMAAALSYILWFGLVPLWTLL